MSDSISRLSYKAILLITIGIVGIYPQILFGGRVISDDPMVFAAHIKFRNGSNGSGFYVNDGKYLYLVTAKHVLYKIENNKITNTLIDNTAYIDSYSRNEHYKITILAQLNLLDATNDIRRHPEKDIVIVRLAAMDGNRLLMKKGVIIHNEKKAILTSTPITMLKQFDNVSIGNDIYIFGFPASIGIQEFPQIEYDKPLLRKGILAGKNEIRKILILDCLIYWGNSGGPVLEVDEGSIGMRRYNIIGIITQYVPLLNKWEDIQRQTKLEASNSGYSVAEPVDDINGLIQQWQ